MEAVRLDGQLSLAVPDTGAGFPPSFLPERSSRSLGRTRPGRASDGGAGLGLAIVAAVAASHGGSAQAAQRSRGWCLG